jgi:hypothetical protein
LQRRTCSRSWKGDAAPGPSRSTSACRNRGAGRSPSTRGRSAWGAIDLQSPAAGCPGGRTRARRRSGPSTRRRRRSSTRSAFAGVGGLVDDWSLCEAWERVQSNLQPFCRVHRRSGAAEASWWDSIPVGLRSEGRAGMPGGRERQTRKWSHRARCHERALGPSIARRGVLTFHVRKSSDSLAQFRSGALRGYDPRHADPTRRARSCRCSPCSPGAGARLTARRRSTSRWSTRRPSR